MVLDIGIIAVYIIIINIIGFRSSRVKTIEDYYLGHRSVPWPVACMSIVATETSTLTFISIPGLAYITDLGFLQIALGYIAGRVLVAFVLIPGYFKGNIETTYEFLQKTFGEHTRRFMSVIFHITRLLADSIRLFATAIPLAMLMGMQGNYSPAVLLIGLATFLYTLYGGIRSVVIVDSIQFGLYLFCAVLGIALIVDITGNDLMSLFSSIPAENRVLFTTGLSSMHELFTSYNIISGIIGGALLSFATHGTDHLLVQRVLSCRNRVSAQKAMIGSGIIVFFQFALFLLLGLCIKVLLGDMTFDKPDEIMPHFILNYLPHGIRGLMLAGIFAAAMSTLSSSINSLSSSTALDILSISHKEYSEDRKIRLSRIISLVWTLVIIAVSVFIQDTGSPLVELGLAITSLTSGAMLGIFLQGVLFRGFSDKAALAGVVLSIAVVITVGKFADLFWPWYVPLGLCVSLISGVTINKLISVIR